MRHLNSLARNERGASALEFALVVPLFIALMLGVVDLGRYLLTQHELDSLASATARAVVVKCGQAPTHYGKLAADCATMNGSRPVYGLTTDAEIQKAAPFIYATRGSELSVVSSCGTCTATGQITITASLPSFALFLPIAGIIPGWSSDARSSMGAATSQTATLYY